MGETETVQLSMQKPVNWNGSTSQPANRPVASQTDRQPVIHSVLEKHLKIILEEQLDCGSFPLIFPPLKNRVAQRYATAEEEYYKCDCELRRDEVDSCLRGVSSVLALDTPIQFKWTNTNDCLTFKRNE